MNTMPGGIAVFGGDTGIGRAAAEFASCRAAPRCRCREVAQVIASNRFSPDTEGGSAVASRAFGLIFSSLAANLHALLAYILDTPGSERVHSNVERQSSMLFMVIERFKDNDMLPIYKRVRDGRRMFPDGLKYIDSWIEPNFSRCFQLMECDDLRLLQQWILNWRGSGATFEIVPVVNSKETREVVAPHVDKL